MLNAGAISIHALLAESDTARPAHRTALCNFYPRSPCGERLIYCHCLHLLFQFLSTLSLRRATISALYASCPCSHFYPRSPCGERLDGKAYELMYTRISIHALLAESDAGLSVKQVMEALFLSTLSLRRATPTIMHDAHNVNISIHALLAESDKFYCCDSGRSIDFYPRSPCGERLRGQHPSWGEYLFLSTLSLRRATGLSCDGR